jgi:hypothetical protein
MKLDPRFVLPAALAAVALAVPAGSAPADPPATGACPDNFMGPFPIGDIGNKDQNGNGFVCVKTNQMNIVFKDDNCNPNCDQDDLNLPIAGSLTDAYADDILP